MKNNLLKTLWWVVFVLCLPVPLLAAIFLAIGEGFHRLTNLLDHILYPIWPGPENPPLTKSEY